MATKLVSHVLGLIPLLVRVYFCFVVLLPFDGFFTLASFLLSSFGNLFSY